MGKLTKAQRRLPNHVRERSGRLYGSMNNFRGHRQDVLRRLVSMGLIEYPRVTPTHTWELTEAGRTALTQEPDNAD